MELLDKPTVQDIFLRFYPGYLEKYSPSPEQSKVANCIINCKTGAYGANISICEDCGHTQIHYLHHISVLFYYIFHRRGFRKSKITYGIFLLDSVFMPFIYQRIMRI